MLQAPEGESQPSTEVDLFISTEKIMVLNTDLKVSRALLFISVLCLQDLLLCATVIVIITVIVTAVSGDNDGPRTADDLLHRGHRRPGGDHGKAENPAPGRGGGSGN